MSFDIVLGLLGGLALFLYGMQMMSSGLAVSYTHLDVYKRQLHHLTPYAELYRTLRLPI